MKTITRFLSGGVARRGEQGDERRTGGGVELEAGREGALADGLGGDVEARGGLGLAEPALEQVEQFPAFVGSPLAQVQQQSSIACRVAPSGVRLGRSRSRPRGSLLRRLDSLARVVDGVPPDSVTMPECSSGEVADDADAPLTSAPAGAVASEREHDVERGRRVIGDQLELVAHRRLGGQREALAAELRHQARAPSTRSGLLRLSTWSAVIANTGLPPRGVSESSLVA